MTGNLLLDSLISLGVILILVAAAYAFFGRGDAAVTIEAAQERLAFEEPDFAAAEWLVDEDGGAALARSAAGEYALVRRLGVDLAVRRFNGDAARAAQDGGALVIRLGDVGMGPVRIHAADAARWADALSGKGA